MFVFGAVGVAIGAAVASAAGLKDTAEFVAMAAGGCVGGIAFLVVNDKSNRLVAQKRAVGAANTPATAPNVRLRGGPLDGFLVNDGADVLAEDWYTTWSAEVAAKNAPGRYIVVDATNREARAEWR